MGPRILTHILLANCLFALTAEGQTSSRRSGRTKSPSRSQMVQPGRAYPQQPSGTQAGPQQPYPTQQQGQPRYGYPPPPQGQPLPPGVVPPQPYMPAPQPIPVRPPMPFSPPQQRNQNPMGQPAALPPHLRARDELTGIRNWFGSAGSAFGFETLSRNNPGAAECTTGCKKTIEEPRWALQMHGAIGWGPIKRNNISFTSHYRYTQNYRTNDEQAARFGTWFKTFKTGDFIFPMRDMLRSHELVTEVRYSATPWQAGLHAMLDFERVGSSASFLGEPNEIADSVRNIEQVVPWIQWRIPGVYIATLYSPMRTEINKEDPRNSFTTWSFQNKGRGVFMTAIQDNLFYFPKISSTANLTLNWTNKKSASIQNDSSRLGLKTGMDFPIAYNIRMQPYARYDVDNYILARVKLDNNAEGTAELLKRSDSIFGMGGTAYFDLSKNWRFSFQFNYESTQSSLSDFSGSKMAYIGGFAYSWPATRQVLRRLDRFVDPLTSEEN